MAVHQHVAHGEVLSQTNHGVVNRRVAVRMIMTQHVADTGGGFFKGFIRGQAGLIHRVQNAAMYRLEPVAHVRQSTADNDAHGIVDIAALHLADQF